MLSEGERSQSNGLGIPRSGNASKIKREGEIIEVTWVLRKVTIQLPYVFLDPIIADLADPISTNGRPWYESYSKPSIIYLAHQLLVLPTAASIAAFPTTPRFC
jgi:hypothetical protein